MTPDIAIISSDNLSLAWAQSFLRVMDRGIREIMPLVVTVASSDGAMTQERPEIRNALDTQLSQLKSKYTKLQLCHTVANTIFPRSLWNPAHEDDATQLFQRFKNVWPQIHKCSQNRRGSYFHRLTEFRGRDHSTPVNQLAHIIATFCNGNHRRSALQAAVFDPALDHTNCPLQGFPCLHQVAFSPVGEKGLGITGFYATQYILDRAYGNYLGLCWLGDFMAKQMNLQLCRMTCIASIAQLGTPNKSEVQWLAEQLRKYASADKRST